MRIAFVTDEFPPDTPGGGIATYLVHATAMLSERGDDVEVFAPSPFRDGLEERDGFRVNWVGAPDETPFRERVVKIFAERHSTRPFDVVEGNDYNASALGVRTAFPDVPYVVKLHTPGYFVEELHRNVPPYLTRLRMHIGALRRGRLYRPWTLAVATRRIVSAPRFKMADEIASPSQAIADEIMNRIPVDPRRISIFPYCFAPSAAFLSIDLEHNPDAIIFMGRLEVRKGVLDLARAFIQVAARHPEVTLTFVGRPMPMPCGGGRTTEDEIRAILGPLAARVAFLGQRDRDEIPPLLAEAGIAVFPSHWESFGLVCCEAMAAARAVVGSASGGIRRSWITVLLESS